MEIFFIIAVSLLCITIYYKSYKRGYDTAKKEIQELVEVQKNDILNLCGQKQQEKKKNQDLIMERQEKLSITLLKEQALNDREKRLDERSVVVENWAKALKVVKIKKWHEYPKNEIHFMITMASAMNYDFKEGFHKYCNLVEESK